MIVARAIAALTVLACGAALAAAPPAAAIGPALGLAGGHPCAVFSTSPTLQAGVGQVEGTGYIQCPGLLEGQAITYTMTVCAQRSVFFRPTQLMWSNGDTCTRGIGGLDTPRWAESLDDTVPCGTAPLYTMAA